MSVLSLVYSYLPHFIFHSRVIFYFKSSKKSNNGTDVNAGQIPQLLYRINTHEGSAPPKQLHDSVEPVPILSKSFYMTVRNVS